MERCSHSERHLQQMFFLQLLDDVSWARRHDGFERQNVPSEGRTNRSLKAKMVCSPKEERDGDEVQDLMMEVIGDTL